LFIVQAILKARTEIIVYFLLSSWLEGLGRDGRAKRTIPPEATRLPIQGERDLRRRVSLVREQIEGHPDTTLSDLRMLEEAAATLSVASEQVRDLLAGHDRELRTRATDRQPEPEPADSL
jgi:hypothetical protein